MVRRCGTGISLAMVALVLAVWPAMAAGEGTILSLIGVGAAQPGDPISISSSVQALADIQNSNLYYTITAPSGALVAQRTFDPGRMRAGQTVNDAWSTGNTPETGTYTVTLCWSTGASTNCNIASASTSFYSVPTLGWVLSLTGGGLIAIWIYRNRFALAFAEAR
jgi:hypothetical protein